MNAIEEMYQPCSEDICDGTGTIADEDGTERTCLCMLDSTYDADLI